MPRRFVALTPLSPFVLAMACNASTTPTPPNAVDPAASGMPSTSAGSAGSAGSAASSSAPPSASGETGATLDDDGKSFTVARGATFAIKLTAQSGTGYTWEVTKVDGAALTQTGKKVTEGTPQTPGAAQREVFHFTAAAQGTARIELALRRPWETDMPPAKTFHVSVTVP